MAIVPVRTRIIPRVVSLELGRAKDAYFGDAVFFADVFEDGGGGVIEGGGGVVEEVEFPSGGIATGLLRERRFPTFETFLGDESFLQADRRFDREQAVSEPITGIIDRPVTGIPCSPGFWRSLACIPTTRIEMGPGTPTPAVPLDGGEEIRLTPSPIQNIIDSIMGSSVGGVGPQFPVGTVGTRVIQPVADATKRNPLAIILLLVGVGAIGWYLYRRYKKEG